jgi:hypothetical protein
LSLSLSEESTAGSLAVRKSEIVDLLQSLPRNLHWDKHAKQAKQQAESQGPASLDILEEEEDDEDDEAEKGLDIAWQYRKSVQRERLAQPAASKSSSKPSLNVFCHSYDLSGRMSEQPTTVAATVDPSNHVVEVQCCQERPCRHSRTCGFGLFRELVSLIQKREEGKVLRLLLFHPNMDTITVALPLVLAHIRQHKLPVVVLVCIPPTAAHTKAWTLLRRTCDVVLLTEGFASRKEYPPPAEFRHLQGLLTIQKASTVTAATANGGGHFGDLTTSKRPAAYIYGLKRDRRKLNIPLLHIPPEDYAAGGGSTSGVRSGGGRVDSSQGMGCSSNTAGSILDF